MAAECEPRPRSHAKAAVIRLSHITEQAPAGPLAEQLIAGAIAGGANGGLEARIWAAVELLGTAGQREAALDLADQVPPWAGEHPAALGRPPTSGGCCWPSTRPCRAARPCPRARPADRFRRQPAQDAAQVVLRAVAGRTPTSACRTSCLEAELAAYPPTPAMTGSASTTPSPPTTNALGEYHQALPTASTNSPSAPPSSPQPPGHPDHPQQHRALDRRVRGPRGGPAPVPGAAARPGAGPRPRTTPAPSPPATTSRTGPASAGTARGRCACPGSCCPTG